MSIALVSTGGTIASSPTSVKKLDADDLLDTLPESRVDVPVETRNFSNFPSTNIRITHMYSLSEMLTDLDTDPSIDGIVVTHGTDTLEESAYFIDLCYDGDTPVVFTGAMRTPSMAGPDGPANVLNSIRVVADQSTSDLGVLIVLGDRVYAACGVVKTHSTSPDSFASPEFGPLATVDHDCVVWSRTPTTVSSTYTPDPEQLTNNVLAVTVPADASGRAIRAGTESEAVCVGVPGAGNLPPAAQNAITDLRQEHIPTVVTSRCIQGRLSETSNDLAGLNTYVSDRNLLQTRIKTIVALSTNRLDDAFSRIK